MPRGSVGRWLVVALGAAVAAGACSGKTAEHEASPASAAVDDGKLAVEEDGLLARRDALLSRRVELRQKKDDLDDRRRAIVAQGGDTRAIDEEVAALATSEDTLVGEERQLNGKL